MKFRCKRQSGFSLLELILVLAVIVSIFLASYHQYRKYTTDKDLAAMKQNVALLLQAADNYYKQYIITPERIAGTLNINNNLIVQAGLWPQLLPTSLITSSAPVTDSYMISSSAGYPIKPPAHDEKANYYTHQLILTVTLDPETMGKNSLAWYARMLNATATFGSNQLIWKKMPSYAPPQLGAPVDPAKTELEIFKKNTPATDNDVNL